MQPVKLNRTTVFEPVFKGTASTEPLQAARRGLRQPGCAKTVPKPYSFSSFELALSEEQIPQVVVNTEKWCEKIEELERAFVLRRQWFVW